ncbi:MAG: UvrD-helicase domain-containing protein [Bacillota bacterium]|nr:UvrD-helicase domain-containing protein [Bacillota bacterium]MDW7684743.1 UvrD-helicase domain-containing protein [Bacillota bacterium]
MNKVPLHDEQAREAIRTRLDKTFLVEAGAGSGKTTSLVGRMTALIASGSCRMENLAAVTFTRKAAGELRERFQEKLEKAYQTETDSAKKERLLEGLSKLDRAFIGTIHSFCSRLLRERPVEAGMSPDFTEIEGLEEQLLAQAAWEEYLLEVRFLHPHLLEKIRAIDVTPQDLKSAYLDLILYPDVELNAPPAPYPDLAPVRKEIKSLLSLAEVSLQKDTPDGGWDKLQLLLRQMMRWQRIFDLNEDRNIIRLLGNLDKSAKPTQKKWLDKNTAKTMEAYFNTFRDTIVKPTLQTWYEYRYPHLLEFLLPAVNHFQTVRRRENKVNFQDLLMRSAALLKENSEVRAYFQERFTHILIDEFQDTDPIQAEIMMFLTGSDLGETDWTRLGPKPGALFVVGDPKQSIYRFRRADIDTYNRVKEQIKASGGKVLHLTANFRSLSDIIDWVNPAFDKLLSRSTAPYQAEAVTMQPVRRLNPSDTGGLLKIELPPVNRHKQETIVMEDAVRIASWIRTSIDGGLTLTRIPEEAAAGISPTPTPGDFMILVRYKSYMAHYARALEEYNIPFSLSGGSDIAASRELRELHILLSALADPDNPVPLVSALRGLFFGISDQDLYRFKKADGRFSMLASIPEEADQRFKEAWQKLGQYRNWIRTLPPSAALENITADLGLVSYCLSGSMGKGRAGYIIQLIELIRSREQNGRTTFTETVDFIAELLEAGMEDELDVTAGTAPGVRIMNLHKAKGLEAPVVILANPGKNVDREPSLHVSRTAGRPKAYLEIQKKSGYRPETIALPQNWASHQQEEARYQQAEETRLLYVAATRAKNILLVSTYPAKTDQSPWHALEDFLAGTKTLDIAELPLPETAEPPTPITPDLLRETTAQIHQDMARITQPTYTRATVTKRSKQTDAPSREHTGRGMTWGNVIHHALEALVRYKENIDLHTLIPELLRREGRPETEKEEVLACLHTITESPFWQRVRRAKEKHPEVTFGIRDGDTYLTGTIDLAFREADGWTLIDYKTDTVRDEAHLQELVRYYEPQIREYAGKWQEMTGERVHTTGLYFVGCNTLHEL